MDLFADVKALVVGALGRLAEAGRLPQGLDLGAVAVEPPRDPAHGDMATNAAMVLARPAGMAPRDIAEALAGELAGAPGIVSATVAGPGFLNLRLEPGRWFGVIPAALAAGADFGRSRGGRRAEGERRVRLGQPDRADARGARAGGGLRRRAGRAPRLRRAGGDAGILHQRRRGAGRRAGAVGLRALPRGLRAGAGDRRGALSRRLSHPGGRGAEGEVRRDAARQARNRRGWPRCGSSRPRRCWR